MKWLTWLQFSGGTVAWLILALHSGPNNIGRFLLIVFATVNTLQAVLRAANSKLLAENRRR